MPTYSITVTDKVKIAALTDALNEYNNRLGDRGAGGPRRGPNAMPPGTPLSDYPGYLGSIEEFLQLQIDRMIPKYVAQFGYNTDIKAKEDELADLKAKIAAATAVVVVTSV